MPVALDAMLVMTPDVCGGRLRIDGTRITVHRITLLCTDKGKQQQALFNLIPICPMLKCMSPWPIITKIKRKLMLSLSKWI